MDSESKRENERVYRKIEENMEEIKKESVSQGRDMLRAIKDLEGKIMGTPPGLAREQTDIEEERHEANTSQEEDTYTEKRLSDETKRCKEEMEEMNEPMTQHGEADGEARTGS